MRVAVVGAGWAGLAAAVEATRLGHRVTVLEMAPHTGGRARGVDSGGNARGVEAAGGLRLDNGQHILIGAYTETQRLMQQVGVDTGAALLRTPLRIVHPGRGGLELEPGPAMAAFTGAVWRHPGWKARDKFALLAAAASWSVARFRCAPSLTVAGLTARLPPAVRADLIDPLCVAALNTPSGEASAAVFLRVMQDALFSGAGSADLLLPRVGLDELLPLPAARWLTAAGASIRHAHRVEKLRAHGKPGEGWKVDGEAFDAVVLAASAPEAARLAQAVNAEWSRCAAALRFEPIVTVYLQSDGTTLPHAMLALHATAQQPAQFVFDRGQLGGPRGLLAFVVSGAQAWVDRGREATLAATLQQATESLGRLLRGPLRAVQVLSEKRATFRCTPGLARPGAVVAPGLFAAGDHVDGPYPATLEGAVRSGLAAARQVGTT